MAVYYAIDQTDSISHHGIKGMKWGVRRFQNPDGSLTFEGKKRYSLQERARHYGKQRANENERKYNEAKNTFTNQKLRQEVQNIYGIKGMMRVAKDLNKGYKMNKAISREESRKRAKVEATALLASLAVLASGGSAAVTVTPLFTTAVSAIRSREIDIGRAFVDRYE